MKILYSHRTQSADGQYVHIRALTDALIARGHELCLVGPEGVSSSAMRALDADHGAAQQASKRLGGIKVPKAIYETAEFGYSLPAWRRLARAAQKFQPDIIYERYNLYYHAGLWLKKQTGLPLILEVNAPLREERIRHGGLALRGLAAKSETTLWKKADYVLPVTDVLAQRVTNAGVDPGRIKVIQNGVDTDFLEQNTGQTVRQRYNLAGKTILGFTGFVRDWHGVDRVLTFMKKQADPNLHLLLVGDGPARSLLEEQAQALGISHQVTITGIVQRDQVADHVAAFDIALQPAVVAYASPLKLFEYMALGKAILAPASPNICEVLTHHHDGWLFDPDDKSHHDFYEGLKTLCEGQSLRQKLGMAARATLDRKEYHWAANARRVEDIAVRLIGEK